MRKLKLFMAACAAMVGLGASAQLTDGTVYWLQDANTGQFISQGASWGTQATVQDVGGLGLQAVYVSEGVYKLKNIMWNKGNNADLGMRTSDRFLDQAAGEVTLISSGSGYKLNTTDGGYICNNSDSYTAQGVRRLGSTNEEASATVWKFLTKSEYEAAIQAYKDGKAATYATNLGYNSVSSVSKLEAILATDYRGVDKTSSITNASLNSKWDGWTHDTTDDSHRNEGAGIGSGCAEFWNGCGYATQTVSGLPNGLYKIEFVGTFRPKNANEANNIASGEASSPAYVYANDAKIEFLHWIDVPAKANGRSAITKANGYGHSFYTYVSDGTLNLGVVQGCWENNYMWCPFGQFTLTYYSNEVSNDDAEALLATVPTGNMSKMAQTNLTNAKEAFEADHTIANYNDLTAAIAAANISIANYAEAKAYLDKASNLDEAGQASYNANETVAAVKSAYEEATLEALTDEQKTALDAAIIVAAKAQTTVGSDWTLALVNPSFENGFSSGWTNTGMAIQNNTSFEKDGNNYCEKWEPNGTFSVKQTITLPAGVYAISAKAKARGVTSAKLFANGIETAVTVQEATDTYTVQFACDNNAEVEFGFEGVGTGAGSSWLCVDDFHLTLVSAGLPDVTAVTGKMNADVAAAQTTAIETYNANKTVANYNAASAAITAAEASVAAYAKMPQAIADATALKDAHNFVTAAAATAFAEAIAAAQAGYDNGTLTDAEANNYANLGVIAVGWHASRAEADWTSAEAYMRSAGFNAEFNDWSIEGGNDGSNFLVPFFQNWISDVNSLANTTITATLTDLPNGLYSVQAWVRVRAKNETAATDATGITMDVNGGGEGDYAAVDVTEGTQVGESQFQIGTYTAQGLVKQGNLTLNFNIADANISWLSFKNVKYTKVRDLTPEEEFVAATAEDYAALNAAIAAHTLGFEAGEYAPYNNVAGVAAVAAAQAIDQQAENAQEDVQAATAAITSATWTANTAEVNAVYDGTFAAAENNGAPAGWTMSNNTLGGDYHSRAFVGENRLSEFNDTKSGFFLRFDGTNSNRGSMYYYGNTSGYTMPLKAETYYRLIVYAANWGDKTNKPLRLNVTGPEGFTAVGQTINTMYDADKTDNEPQQFNILFKATVAGNYVINFQCPGDGNEHNVIVSNVVLKKAVADEITIAEDATTAPAASEYANVTLNRAFNKGWNAVCLPFATPAFDGAEIAEFTGETVNGDNVTLNFEKKTAFEANKPYLVYFPATVEGGKVFEGVAVAPASDVKAEGTAFDFMGTYTVKDIVAGNWVVSGGALKKASKTISLKATRTYFTPKSPSGNARIARFTIDGVEASGISAIFTDEAKATDGIYNLQGQKVSGKMQKGIYIMNGKKVIK